MTIKLSSVDHKKLDTLLDTVLAGVQQGNVSILDARSIFAHVIAAAALGNESEVRGWLKAETLEEWKKLSGVTGI